MGFFSLQRSIRLFEIVEVLIRHKDSAITTERKHHSPGLSANCDSESPRSPRDAWQRRAAPAQLMALNGVGVGMKRTNGGISAQAGAESH